MKKLTKKVLLLLLFSFGSWAYAKTLDLDTVIGFSYFEQQVKTRVGGVSGQVLTADSEFNVGASAFYPVMEWFEVGVFARADFGYRQAGQFSSFDSNGTPIIINSLGGRFAEFWAGPMLRFRWKTWFGEVGYGLLGLRSDNARTDISNASGQNFGNFGLNPVVAWAFGLGANLDLSETIALILKVEYRLRYYNTRGGQVLANSMEHGTQNLTPHVGIKVAL